MRAGRLDRRIDFYSKVSTRDDFNASVDTWPKLTLTTWGEVRYIGGGEILSNEEKFYSGAIYLKTRYRSSIIETMRVSIAGIWYRITYIEELGRKEGMTISLTKINE